MAGVDAKDNLKAQTITLGTNAPKSDWPVNMVLGTSSTTAYEGDWGASVSGQVAILNTNTFPRQSGLSVSNDVAIVKTNYFPLQSGLNVSNRVGVLETNTAPLQSYLNTSNTVVILNTNTAPLQSYIATSNQVAINTTNLFPMQSGLNISNRVGVLESTYAPYSSTNYANSSTVTVNYAHGGTIKTTLTNNPTVLFFANDYPTNGVNRVSVDVYAGTNITPAFVVGNVTNQTAPVYSNTVPASLIFRKSGTNTLWEGSQIRR